MCRMLPLSRHNWRMSCRFCACYRLRRFPGGLAVLADDVPNLFNMLPRIQGRPLRGLLVLVKMLHRFERTLGASLLLPRFFLLRRHILLLGQHVGDAFVQVFLFLALGLDRFRLGFKLHARGKTAAAQAVRDLDR